MKAKHIKDIEEKKPKDDLLELKDFDTELPDWEKGLIDERLKLIEKYPDRLRDVEELFKVLKSKV